MKKIICFVLTIFLVTGAFAGCTRATDENKKTQDGIQLLSFSQAQSVDEMKKSDGEQVTIIGYMSTLSPINGEFMYLMNLPYQNCPFCVPNTTELANTMAVYAPEGDSFEFTDRAIQVTGTLEFGDYTDEYGYEYSYRIKDASYEILDTQDMSDELRLWQQLASTDVISDVYNMYEYVNFLCYWPTYTAEFGEGKDYLYPSDAKMFFLTEEAQYNYGYKENYFSDMIATIEGVDANAFSALVENIKAAQALSEKAIAELEGENYSITKEYSDAFGDGRNQYKLTNGAALEEEMHKIYSDFSMWLAEWEL